MAKKLKGCCLGFLMGIVFMVAALAGGIYFGGNYAINRYFGENGELIALGIRNWGEAYQFINMFGTEPDVSGIIHEESAPTEESKSSAMEKLKQFGFPVIIDGEGNPTGELDIGKILSGEVTLSAGEVNTIDVSGAEMASIINAALATGAAGQVDFNGMKIEQIHLDYINAEEADITVTLSVPLDKISGQLGAAAFLIKASKIYLTCSNKLTVLKGENEEMPAPGQDKLKSAVIGEGGIKVNDLSGQLSDSIVGAFVNILNSGNTGQAYTPKSLNGALGDMLADAVNSFKGAKSFVANADGDPGKPAATRLAISGTL